MYCNHFLLVSNLLQIHLDIGDLRMTSVLQLSSYLILLPFVFSISPPLMPQSQPQGTPFTTCSTRQRIVYYTIVSSNVNGNRGRYFAKVSGCMRNPKAWHRSNSIHLVWRYQSHNRWNLQIFLLVPRFSSTIPISSSPYNKSTLCSYTPQGIRKFPCCGSRRHP